MEGLILAFIVLLIITITVVYKLFSSEVSYCKGNGELQWKDLRLHIERLDYRINYLEGENNLLRTKIAEGKTLIDQIYEREESKSAFNKAYRNFLTVFDDNGEFVRYSSRFNSENVDNP